MEIKLQIDDEKFDKIFGNLEENFTQEMKEEAIKKAIEVWAAQEQSQKAIKNCLLENYRSYNSDYYNYSERLSDLGKEIVTKAILEEGNYIKEIQDMLMEMMRDNGKELIIKALAEVVIQSFTKSEAFESAAHEIASDTARIIVNNYLSNHNSQY